MRHVKHVKPGLRNGRPILVNGREWYPEWRNPNDPRGRDTSKPYPLPIGSLDFKLVLLGVKDLPASLGKYRISRLNRGTVKLVKGKGEVIVQLDDSAGGGDWYCFKLTRSERSTQLREPGAKLGGRGAIEQPGEAVLKMAKALTK